MDRELSMELIVRRAFTSVHLRIILEENHHLILIVEHRAYERARDTAGCVAQAMKQASREATILLYAPVLDRHLEVMAEYAVPWSSASTICRGRATANAEASRRSWQARPPRFS